MISGALGLVSIALADKGILMAILLVVFILVFVIGGARNLTEMRQDTDEAASAEGVAEQPETGEARAAASGQTARATEDEKATDPAEAGSKEKDKETV